MKTIIEELVQNVLAIQYEDFDEVVVENAKKRIIDVIGCLQPVAQFLLLYLIYFKLLSFIIILLIREQ